MRVCDYVSKRCLSLCPCIHTNAHTFTIHMERSFSYFSVNKIYTQRKRQAKKKKRAQDEGIDSVLDWRISTTHTHTRWNAFV